MFVGNLAPCNNQIETLKIIVNSAWRPYDGIYIRLSQQNEPHFDNSWLHCEVASGFIEESLLAVTPN